MKGINLTYAGARQSRRRSSFAARCSEIGHFGRVGRDLRARCRTARRSVPIPDAAQSKASCISMRKRDPNPFCCNPAPGSASLLILDACQRVASALKSCSQKKRFNLRMKCLLVSKRARTLRQILKSWQSIASLRKAHPTKNP